MMKKVLSLALACIMATSLLPESAAASNLSKNESDGTTGEIIEFNLVKADENGISTCSDHAEIVEYMENRGWVPGSTFHVGNKQYKVLDDYQIEYLGIDENCVTNHISDATRAVSIPTVEGDLPYSGTYSILNYMYSSHYWNVGSTGEVASIGVIISPDSSHQVRVDWMDARNDESMGYKVLPGTLNGLVWTYGGEDFYLKFTNATSYGSSRISGAFNVYVDQVEPA